VSIANSSGLPQGDARILAFTSSRDTQANLNDSNAQRSVVHWTKRRRQELFQDGRQEFLAGYTIFAELAGGQRYRQGLFLTLSRCTRRLPTFQSIRRAFAVYRSLALSDLRFAGPWICVPVLTESQRSFFAEAFVSR